MPSPPRPAREAPRLDWIVPPRALPLWLALIACAWWGRGPHAAGGAAVPAAAAALAARALGWLAEAACLAACWRAVGARVPVLRLAVACASFSGFDLLALALRGAHAGAGSALVAWLAGRAPRPGEGALAALFAASGLCTLARIVCTASAQARALGRGLAAPLALTAGVWLGTRVALACVVDLARGRSPLS